MMKLSMGTLPAIVIYTVVLIFTSSALAESPLTGEATLQLLAGKNFRLQCVDGLHGYGRFQSRNSAWASYKSSAGGTDELERRASAKIRANGRELCFTIDGLDLVGETCAPVRQKTSSMFRFGTGNEWCDVQLIPSLPSEFRAVAGR